ncbi:hypothetical protein TNCV_3441461 [Trichonephila clavipes]|uniref:Uncharacterized protein n=1 Tax=Trichonephila clavipes TaxID=2585209 RepID=A0A8X6W5Y8_TRICX|nr:hypothetical protein TNCV_3441461 [Trichonephila clavipes]
MHLDKQFLVQSAVSKSLEMMIDVQSTVITERNRKTIEKRVQRNPRQIVRDMGISDRSVRAHTKLHKTLDSLKRSLLWEWGTLKVKDLRLSLIVESFCKSLRLYIAANGGHFETN